MNPLKYNCIIVGSHLGCGLVNIWKEKLKDNLVSLANHNLTTYDVECLSVFLTYSRSNMWNLLALLKMTVLVFYIIDWLIVIVLLKLYGWAIITWPNPPPPFTTHCKIENLFIDGNHTVGEDHSLFDILFDPLPKLKHLSVMHTGWSPNAAIFMPISLFTRLYKG